MQPETFPALVAAGARHAVRRVGFWAAVALPALYLPAAAAAVDTAVVAALVVAHAVALLLGHGHRLSTEEEEGEAPRPRRGAPDAD